MSLVHEKLASILRTKPEVVLDLEQKLANLTGKTGIMDKIIEENEFLVKRTLEELGLDAATARAEDVYQALVMKLEHLDGYLYDFLDKPDLSQMSNSCGKLCDVALSLNRPQTGFFIKKNKAVELLEKFPPHNLLEHFKCQTAEELVSKQGFSSVFSALRFAQDTAWMHEFFDKAYNELKAEDFEEREVELKVLETQWLDVAEKFLEKKYHNVSHLKEFGIIFVIPLKIDTKGETLRMFTLILHYLNEVPFYSKLFRKFSKEDNFSSKLKSLLRGDVSESPAPDGEFRIIQRYLAKDDKNDFRLLEPHINPEAEHWYKATGDLSRLTDVAELSRRSENGGWQSLDFVGSFFPDGMSGDLKEELVSFDLTDLVMSLVKKGEVKYLYHQQEALWNKIFIEYFGRDKVNRLVEENIISGFINF